ncbi:ROK family transcriptional regulator [Corynebacterium hylobatis]|uniref:ROK family transcriptional regulator n=2 Tax=Corynebacterium hylobatis TaxID=1859290 RepID=A0A3S0BIA3_9CORY|nr:ROK family transcriptional regulator [Corynebacterium hylobatis]
MTTLAAMPPLFSPQPVPSSLMGMTDQTFLGYLFSHGTGTRAEIARITGISKPTISDSANRLQSAGLIVEAGETPPRGRGRRAMTYQPNPDHGHVSAVVLERRHNVVRALDFCGDLRWEERSETDMTFSEGIAWAREHLAAAAAHMATPCRAATISVAAPVNPGTGAVQPMAGAPLGGVVPDITAALGLADVPRVRVDNDVNWAARAEATDPAKEPERSFLYVYLGAGVGGALVAEGSVIRGANGAAGEISFLRTPKGTTLHAELSSLSFGSPDHSSIDIDLALAALQDPDNGEARYATDLLAQAVLDAATVFDPGTVVLSGPLSAADLLIERLRTRVAAGRIAPVALIRGRADDELLVAGVSRHAVHDAWDAAMTSALTIAQD